MLFITTEIKFYKKQFFLEAPYNAYLWFVAPYAFALRHAVTGVFSLGIVFGALLQFPFPWLVYPYLFIIVLYLLLALLSSIEQAIRYKNVTHVFILPICFFLFHFIHGLGVLFGSIRLVIGSAHVQIIKEPWPGAGKYRAYKI